MPEYRLLGESNIIVLLDPEDIPRVRVWHWNYTGEGKTIQATVDRKTITLPRFILQYSGPLEIDHIDRNILNNLKINFRLANRSQQIANSGPRMGRKYKGTYYDKRRKVWCMRMTFNGKIYSAYGFGNEESAARMYDKNAKEFWGEYAWLNFPTSDK